MVELREFSDTYSLETVNVEVNDPDLDLTAASAIAKTNARSMDSNAMMLSFHSAKTGEFWPHYDCGGGGRPPWVVFAEARGYNLKIDINNGEFEFFYVRL
jgi:hypothetical protein